MDVWIKPFAPLLLAYLASAVTLLLARRSLASRTLTWQRTIVALGRIDDVIFVFLLSAYVITFASLSLLRHESFHTGLDLAIFDQGVWNALAGYPFKSSIVDSAPFWNNYFDPLLIALVPLYALWDNPRTLLVLQTIALAVATFPIYWYARSQLGNLLALAVSLSFLLSPALQFVNLHQFHVIALSTPLVAFALFFLLRQRYAPFLVCTGLAWLVKEEVSLIVIGLGIYVLVIQRKRLLGLCLTVFGVVALFCLLMYVVPFLTGKIYFAGRGQFGDYGTSLPEMVQTFVLRPDKTWNILTAPHKLEFVSDLLVPLASVPLAGIEVLLTSFPMLGSLLLTNPSAAVIQSQYPASIIPSLYFAAIVGLRRLLPLRTSREHVNAPGDREMAARKLALAVLILMAAVASYVVLAPGPLGGSFEPSLFVVNDHTVAGHQLVRQVPRDAVVVAQEELLPHFSNRKDVYDFPTIPDYRQADYLVAEKGRFFYDFHKGWWDRWLSTGYFEIVNEADGFVLARRRDPENWREIKFGDQLTFLGFSLLPKETLVGGMILQPIVAWQAAQPIQERYAMLIQVVDVQGHVWAFQDGEPHDGLSPTNQWRVGKTIGDQYTLKLPPTVPTGDYQMTLGVHEVGDNRCLEAIDPQANTPATEVVLSTVHIQKNKASFIASQLQIEQPLYVDMQEMRFLGYVPPRQTISPGEMFHLGLYWRARRKPQGDYVVAVQLRDSSGRVVAEQKERPAGGTYPTTQWDEGEVLLDWHDWLLPSSVMPSEYAVHVVLSDAASGVVLGETMLVPLSVTR